MKPVAAALVIALLAPLGSPWRESNSEAETKKGARQFAAGDFAGATASFRKAAETTRSPAAAFNMGTAQVAAGERAAGAATLERAMSDPALRADALFNRGNGALDANSLEHAIRDYTQALRVAPAHEAARRNLEIALARQKAAPRPGQGSQQKQESEGEPVQQQPRSDGKGEKPADGRPDAEAILRSVQEQENQELQRMKARRATGRVGW